MLTNPWTLNDTCFSSVIYAFTVLENGRKRIVFNGKLLWKQCFVTGKTPVNNGIQTVFPSVNRTLNTRKTIVFVELTMEENCWIMERILQFAASKTPGERWIFFSENVRKCVNNAAFSNIHNCFPNGWTPYFLQWRISKSPLNQNMIATVKDLYSALCYMEPNCYNKLVTSGSPVITKCELNNSTHNENPGI